VVEFSVPDASREKACIDLVKLFAVVEFPFDKRADSCSDDSRDDQNGQAGSSRS
jgi:hypothetical protein